jgi:hypothetical protein
MLDKEFEFYSPTVKVYLGWIKLTKFMKMSLEVSQSTRDLDCEATGLSSAYETARGEASPSKLQRFCNAIKVQTLTFSPKDVV